MSSSSSVVGSVRREPMRIAGDKVYSDRVIEVRYPWTGEVVATVPKATVDDVKRAFKIARDYKPTLTRHERYKILMKAGDIITMAAGAGRPCFMAAIVVISVRLPPAESPAMAMRDAS